jgi:hypothetical protein
LFIDYPLAVTVINQNRTLRSMVLMLQDGDDAGYFVLSSYHGDASPRYSLWSWPDGDVVDIEAEGGATVPDVVMKVVTRGVPIPRDGSLFGWMGGDAVSALIVIYAEHTPAIPEPSWAVMPLAGVPEAQWPPFAGEPLFGHWTWEHVRAGRIVSLASLVAGNPGTVFWADTKAILGSDCCVVARDVTDPEGRVLRRGRYAYYEVLRAGKPVPSVSALLADASKIDLAPGFRWPESGDRYPREGS